ncbi:TerB family tellurite resistance protein [Salipiger sp. P9]|uniref:tellurite resistance TerB family protein n=1 Tax=Salipiger pentaromativorans TaxID=2943193 RepID=UPI002156FAD4|nr:TerB family tellurite resistance protein [Salipiger pentaromativorans]MCR8549862.1 TerB family tellurite resistance protein [Salipiger pentaromativorans]
MGRNLRFWLSAPEAAPFDPGDAPVALGALLVRLARRECACLRTESAAIDAILARRYDLTAQEAAEMRETCERIEAAAPDTPRFAASLCMAVAYAERRAVALCLWEILRQGALHHSEEARMIALTETVLGVHPDDIAAERRAG